MKIIQAQSLTTVVTIVVATILLFFGLYFFNETPLIHNHTYLNAIVIEISDEYIIANITSFDLRGEIVTIPYSPISHFPLFAERPIYVGDSIRVSRNEIVDYLNNVNVIFGFIDYNRLNVVYIFFGIIFFAVIFFGKLKGFNTLISLIFTYISIFGVLIPSVLSGRNIYVITFIIFSYIIVFSLLLIVGVNKKALGAILGCFVGLIFSSLFMLSISFFTPIVVFMPFETFSENSLRILGRSSTWIFVPDFRGIIFTSVLLGALGAVKDVSASISSSLWELSQSGRVNNSKILFKSGLNIGLDTLSTQVNNLVLAYVGSALPLFLLINHIGQPALAALNRLDILIEVLRALVGIFSLIIVIPATSISCAYLFSRGERVGLDEKDK